MTIEQYLGSLRSKTAKEYRATYNYLQQWKQDTESAGQTFPDFLFRQNLSENTVCKHVRQARTICKETGLDPNLNSRWRYLTLVGTPDTIPSAGSVVVQAKKGGKEYLMVTDDDFAIAAGQKTTGRTPGKNG